MTTALATTFTAASIAALLNRSSQYRLNASMLQTLCLLSAGGADGLTMTSVARELGLSTAAVTGIADSLERLAFIARRDAVSDRRVIWLDLTARGKDALTDILTA